MEYEGGFLPDNSGAQDSVATVRDSVEVAATSDIFRLTNPNCPLDQLDQGISRPYDLQLVQLEEYPLFNDLILNEGTCTTSDELLARTNQFISQHEPDRALEAPHVDADYPQIISAFTASPSLQNQVQNTTFDPAVAIAQQCLASELDTQHYARNESLENTATLVIGNNPFRAMTVNDCEMGQILGFDEDVTCHRFSHVSGLLQPLTNEPAQLSPDQNCFPFREDKVSNTTMRLQSTLCASASAPMDALQDHIQMPPEDMYIKFPEQEEGGLSCGLPSDLFPVIGNATGADQNKLQDHLDTSLTRKIAEDGCIIVTNGIDQGTERTEKEHLSSENDSTWKTEDDVSMRPSDAAIEQLSENQENMVPHQTAMTNFSGGQETEPGMVDMASVEKVRMVFLYPLCKQMRKYEKRHARSRRALHNDTENQKYYAMKRIQQDLRENIEISQKATIVCRQLQLEREHMERALARERQEISQLRCILENVAVGKSL